MPLDRLMQNSLIIILVGHRYLRIDNRFKLYFIGLDILLPSKPVRLLCTKWSRVWTLCRIADTNTISVFCGSIRFAHKRTIEFCRKSQNSKQFQNPTYAWQRGSYKNSNEIHKFNMNMKSNTYGIWARCSLKIDKIQRRLLKWISDWLRFKSSRFQSTFGNHTTNSVKSKAPHLFHASMNDWKNFSKLVLACEGMQFYNIYLLLFWRECGKPLRDSIKTIRFLFSKYKKKYSIDSYQLCFPFLLAVPLFSFFDIIIVQCGRVFWFYSDGNEATKRLFVRTTTHSLTHTRTRTTPRSDRPKRFAVRLEPGFDSSSRKHCHIYYRRIETKITFQTSDETHFENRKLKIKKKNIFTNRNEFVALT